MFFLNFGNGQPGGVGTVTDYRTADEDGAWVGMERYVHPTDAQYSWINRLAELYSARTKNFCRHEATTDRILQEVRENLNLYDFDQCYIFIALSGVKPRLFPIYGDWGSAKDSHWSKYYDYHGLECRMDGTDFDYEKGRELIFNVLKTNGVKKGDTTFESFVDLKFRGFLNEQGLNLDDTDNPLNSFHPDNAIYTDIINEWLKRKEVEYLNECEKIDNLPPSGERHEWYQDELNETLKVIKESDHKFFFYWADDLPGEGHIPEQVGLGDLDDKVKIDQPNVYWFWGISMSNYFKKMNISPRFLNYYQQESHFDFYKYMRNKLTDSKLML
jgi:hypothetical protein